MLHSIFEKLRENLTNVNMNGQEGKVTNDRNESSSEDSDSEQEWERDIARFKSLGTDDKSLNEQESKENEKDKDTLSKTAQIDADTMIKSMLQNQPAVPTSFMDVFEAQALLDEYNQRLFL